MIPLFYWVVVELEMNQYRIESREEIEAYLAKLQYALMTGAEIKFQKERQVDSNRDEKYTNKYTMAFLFPDENPEDVLRRELKKLTVRDYLRTCKDTRFPKRSKMREFGKVYNHNDEIYIKIRVELLDGLGYGRHTTFVMSFHFAEKPFAEEIFPYC